MSAPQPPYSRFAGARYTSDVTHDDVYLQTLYNEDSASMYQGELFLNGSLDRMYYVDHTGVVRTFGARDPILASQVDFSGVREFVDDAAAASADPVVPIGGAYRTGNILKVRVV